MTSYGHAVISGVHLPIRGICLTGGEIHLQFVMDGPIAAGEGSVVTVVGEDGVPVLTDDHARIKWPQVAAGERFAVTVSMRVDTVRGDADA